MLRIGGEQRRALAHLEVRHTRSRGSPRNSGDTRHVPPGDACRRQGERPASAQPAPAPVAPAPADARPCGAAAFCSSCPSGSAASPSRTRRSSPLGASVTSSSGTPPWNTHISSLLSRCSRLTASAVTRKRMAVHAARLPRGVSTTSSARYVSRKNPPSGCGARPSVVASLCRGRSHAPSIPAGSPRRTTWQPCGARRRRRRIGARPFGAPAMEKPLLLADEGLPGSKP